MSKFWEKKWGGAKEEDAFFDHPLFNSSDWWVGDGSFIGELTGASDKKRAGQTRDTVLQSARDAITAQEEALANQEQYLSPYISQGTRALSRLRVGATGLASRRFKYALREGAKSIKGKRAAKGAFRSSGTQTSLRKFVGQLSAEEQGRKYSKQAQLVGMGAEAAGSFGGAAATTGANVSSIYGQTGNQLQQAAQFYGQQRANLYQGLGNLAVQYALL